VHDPYQGQSIGRRLLGLLVQAARERGITRLHALIQSDNEPMLRLLHSVLPQARLEERVDGECTYSADIAVAPRVRALAPPSATIGVSPWPCPRTPRRAPACPRPARRAARAEPPRPVRPFLAGSQAQRRAESLLALLAEKQPFP
jgi:acetyltransferase (GNAT) family protein